MIGMQKRAFQLRGNTFCKLRHQNPLNMKVAMYTDEAGHKS
jgi:hypothetical protein